MGINCLKIRSEVKVINLDTRESYIYVNRMEDIENENNEIYSCNYCINITIYEV